jgi:hypothetical protein
LIEFGFSPILKYVVGVGNEDVDTHPELVLLILKLDFTSFELETLT